MHVWGKGQACIVIWLGNLRESEPLEDPGIDKKIILRWISRKCGVWAWTRSSWLRIRTGGGHV